MRAVVHDRYGSPDVLQLREVPDPVLEGTRVLVRVRAAAVNPIDWHLLRGQPYVMRLSEGRRRPKRRIPGVDVAGIIEAVGDAETELQVGDRVFGGCAGAFAELVRPPERQLARIPDELSFEEAAALPTAGCTALQALRDHGKVQPGQTVLVNGAAGGVGSFLVQIAVALGATVTGVCSTANLEWVRSLGAGTVVDYTTEDFSKRSERFDLVIDAVGNRSISALRRAATPKGRIVLVGGGGGRVFGPVGQIIRGRMVARIARREIAFFLARVTRDDLHELLAMVAGGQLRPVVSRIYRLDEAAAAIRDVESGHGSGKRVIRVDA